MSDANSNAAGSPVVTASALFYAKLNEANPDVPVPFSPDNVTVGNPSTNTDSSKNRNSVVSVTGKPGSKYTGTHPAYYDRVAMADILATAPTANSFPYTNETMIADVLPVFNQTFSVNMVADDIINGQLPPPDSSSGKINFTLAASANSLAFVGNIPLIYVPDDISLTTLTTLNLTGLTPSFINAG